MQPYAVQLYLMHFMLNTAAMQLMHKLYCAIVLLYYVTIVMYTIFSTKKGLKYILVLPYLVPVYFTSFHLRKGSKMKMVLIKVKFSES